MKWNGPRAAWSAAGAALAAAALLLPATVADAGATIHVVRDGRALSLPTPPMVSGGQIFLPLRDLAAALGLAMQWDPATDTLYIGRGAPASQPPAAITLAARAPASPAPQAPATPPAPAGSTFTYDGLKYAATGLVARAYPGDQTNSGTDWIVGYSITDTSPTPIAVPATQLPVLFGSDGAQISADAALSGTAPSVINPGITFSSYEVFNVPSSASPADYDLGFAPTQIVGSQYYFGQPLKMALPADSGSTVKTPVNASYDLENVFGNSRNLTSEQVLTITDTVMSNAIAPDRTAPSYRPNTRFLIVDFTLKNTTSGDISINAGDFALNLDNEDTVTPYDVPSLPGYVQPTGLEAQGGVMVLTGTTFSGSLLFDLPAGTPTANPQLQFSANGQTRVVSLSPCVSGACPPVLG